MEAARSEAVGDDLVHRGREPDPVGERRDEPVDILPRAAADRAPLRAGWEAEQSVVVHEPRVGAHREARERRRIGGPDRAAERNEELLDKRSGVPAATQERLDRLVARTVVASGRRKTFGCLPSWFVDDEAACGAVETYDLGHEAEERWSCEVAPLREQGVEVGAPILEAARGVRDAEAHLGRLRLDAELAQESGESRIVRLVVDDESGVNGVYDAADLNVDRVGVAADSRVGLIDGHLMVVLQCVRRDQSRHAGADDRDPHDASISLRIPERARHQSQRRRRSSGVSDLRVVDARWIARGRRSSQNDPVVSIGVRSSAASHTRVSAP